MLFYGVIFNNLIWVVYYGFHFTVNVCNLVKINRVFILCHYAQHSRSSESELSHLNQALQRQLYLSGTIQVKQMNSRFSIRNRTIDRKTTKPQTHKHGVKTIIKVLPYMFIKTKAVCRKFLVWNLCGYPGFHFPFQQSVPHLPVLL
jgi:hypothetical protein